jgi:hypothetical protein
VYDATGNFGRLEAQPRLQQATACEQVSSDAGFRWIMGEFLAVTQHFLPSCNNWNTPAHVRLALLKVSAERLWGLPPSTRSAHFNPPEANHIAPLRFLVLLLAAC